MDLYEYQARDLFERYGVPVLAGIVAGFLIFWFGREPGWPAATAVAARMLTGLVGVFRRPTA